MKEGYYLKDNPTTICVSLAPLFIFYAVQLQSIDSLVDKLKETSNCDFFPMLELLRLQYFEGFLKC